MGVAVEAADVFVTVGVKVLVEVAKGGMVKVGVAVEAASVFVMVGVKVFVKVAV